LKTGCQYPTEEVARLAREGSFRPTKEVATKLINRNVDANDKIVELLTTLSTHGRFKSCAQLKDGGIGDEYIVKSEEDGYDWYVKFKVADKLVWVLSCKWDGVGYW